jgi:phosphatidylglycerol lysyltransferase
MTISPSTITLSENVTTAHDSEPADRMEKHRSFWAVDNTGQKISAHVNAAKSTPVLRCRKTLSAAEQVRLEQHAFQYASAPESYDIAISPGHILQTSCGQGMFGVLPDFHVWHMPGGIIAPSHLKPMMIDELKKLALAQKKIVAVYSVGEDEVSMFQNAGFAVNKFGEEPVLDLGGIKWQGHAYEWVRRQTNFCRRHGLEITEITSPAEQQSLADELNEIVREDLKVRVYSKPLHLLEGLFDPYLIRRRRLFVARDKSNGIIQGFVACSPLQGGQEWAFETYRKRSTAPRGTTAYIFREVIDRLQSEGVERVSLCLVPGKGVEHDHSATSDYKVRFMLNMWYYHLNFLFNVQGQNYFKSRFRPRYINRYIAVYPKNTLFSIGTFLKTSGALQPNYFNLMRHIGACLMPRAKAQDH